MTQLFVSVFVITVAMPVLSAESLPLRGPIPFPLYDMNGDGSISSDEFQAIRSQRMADKAAQGYPMRNAATQPQFSQFDTNNDGYLTPDELTRGQRLQQQKRWAMKQNQRMGMSGQNRPMNGGSRMPVFETFDDNKDGVLTRDEFLRGQQRHRQQNRMQCMGMQQGQNRSMGSGRNMPKFEDFDGNKDGFISEEELIKGRSMRISQRIQQGYQMRNTANIPSFQSIDTNGDGKISPDEFYAHQQQHQLMRGKMPN